jgi:hypothetical protein
MGYVFFDLVLSSQQSLSVDSHADEPAVGDLWDGPLFDDKTAATRFR